MDAQKNKIRGIKNGLMQRTVAYLVTVLFIFNGIPVPTSFAAHGYLTGRDHIRTRTLAEANSKTVSDTKAVPSGSVTQSVSPLSAASDTQNFTTAAYDPSRITVLPDRPVIGSGVGSGETVVSGTLQVHQTSSRNIQMQYSNLDSDDFAFVYLSGSAPMNLSASGLTVAAKGTPDATLKLEIKDVSNHVATVPLTLTSDFKNYVISSTTLQTLSPQLDATRIREIVFVADKANAGSSGTVEIETAGLAYTPVVVSNPALTPADVSTFSGIHHLIDVAGPEGAFGEVSQQSSSLYTLSYALPPSAGWAAGVTSFDDYRTPAVESRDLTGMTNLVLGLRLSSGSGRIKVEFEDAARNKGVVHLADVGTSEQFYAIPMSELLANNPGLDLHRITNINVVVESHGVSQPTGELQVRLGEHPYKPKILPDTFLTSENLTPLPGNPVITVIYGGDANAAATAHGRGGSFTYNTGIFGWAGGGLTFDHYGTPEIETNDLSGFSEFVFGLKGTAGTIKLEFVDANDQKAFVHLTGIESGEENIYRIPATLFQQVDLSKVRTIYVIIEGIGLQGTMDLYHVPAIPQGWTRAASNANYAFLQSGGTSRTLSLMDLRTGQVQALVTVDLAMTHPDHISQVYDVSEDGTTVIFGVTRAWSSIGGETYVQRITDASSRLTLAGNLESIEMDGMIAILMVKGIEQRIDLATLLLLPPVLSWSPAASNADYQVAVEQQPDGTKTLHIKNFSTGVEAVIAGINGAMDFYDVSPDGTTVLYGQRASKDPAVVGFTVLYSLTTPDRQVTLMSGGMMTYSFTDYGEITLKTFSFPVEVYQLGTLERYDFNIVTETVNSPGNVYQLKDERSVGMFKFVKLGTPDGVRSFDLSPEESPVTDYLLTDHGLYYIAGHNNPAEIKYLDLDAAYQTGNFDPVSLTVQNGVEANDPAQINYASLAVADPASVTIPGPLGSRESMKFVSAGELLKITDASGGVRFIQLSTGLEVAPPVPAGWTRAASNANYAFATEDWINPDNRNNYTRLKIQDLRTGEIRELYSLQSPPNSYTSMDISPSGELVYFGVRNDYATPATGWLRVQQVGDAAKQADITGIPQSVGFLSDGDVSVVMATAYRNGTRIGDVYVVDQTTLASTLSHHTLLEQADAVLDEGYLIVPTKITYSNTCEVFVYDASAGTEHLVLTPVKIFYPASQAAGGSSGSGSYRTIDVYRTPSGKTVLTVGVSATGNGDADYSKTFIINLGTAAQMTLSGAVTAVEYRGSVAVCAVTHSGGAVETKYVDLDTLQLMDPPLPAGWTRAASNVNYAFKIETVNRYSKLILLDLKTGESKVLFKVYKGGRYSTVPVSSVYDVSPDGATVVYGIAPRSIYVQKIADATQKLRVSGAAKSVVFEGMNAVITKTNGSQTWVDMNTLKIVPRPIPAGWTAVPSLATLAYQTISGNKVRVMNLTTGAVSEKPSSQDRRGYRSGLYYVMTATGLKEIYTVKSGRRSVLKSYDPVTRKWASFKQ